MKRCLDKDLKKMTRKELLRAARKHKALENSYRGEVIGFITMVEMDQVQHFDEALSKIMFYGFRGYDRLSNKDIMKMFEKIYGDLRDVDVSFHFYSTRNKEYFKKIGTYQQGRSGLDKDDQIILRNLYLERSEQLMLQLFESIVLV